MVHICKKVIGNSQTWAMLLSITCAFCQDHPEATYRLDNFINKSCETDYNKITSKAVNNILKYDVFHITQKTKNIYGEKDTEIHQFIVVDNGQNVKRFEHIDTNTSLPELTSYIQEDFHLNQETAFVFQSMLDDIYPIADWKPDKREFFLKNGKWYFLRDAYFRSKQGFEITVDSTGKITNICYKMKWDEAESK